MTIGRAKAAGWGTNEIATSSQLNGLDTNIAKAVDRTSAGDTVSGVLSLAGVGRIRPNVVVGANPGAGAEQVYLASGANRVIRVTSATTASCFYDFDATDTPVTGDSIEIYCDSTFVTFEVTLRDQADATLFVLGNLTSSDGTFARLMYYTGVGWQLQSSRGSRTRSQTFSVVANNGTGANDWICPKNVTEVFLSGVGGGGGGASGYYSPTQGTNRSGTGGGGGGGALLGTYRVAVTPGSTYAVIVGDGGAGGTGGVVHNQGGDGLDTTFGSIACFSGAQGGSDGTLTTSASTVDVITSGGACTRGAPRSGTATVAVGINASWSTGPAAGGCAQWSFTYINTPGIGNLAQGGRANQGVSAALCVGGGGGNIGAFAAGTTYMPGGLGGGGGGGPYNSGGVGGTGGTGSDIAVGGNGSAGGAAPALSGAGGGGGGCCGFGAANPYNGNSGSGGKGGSGQLTVTWVK